MAKETYNATQSFLLLLGILMTLGIIVIFFYQLNFADKNVLMPSEIKCGGFTGKSCPIGQKCVYPEPTYPDQMGVCKYAF